MPFDVRRLGQGCPWPGSGRGPMGRDVPAISVSQQDRLAYREKVCCCLDVFARMLRESRFDTEPRQVGLEIELHMVDEAGRPSMKNGEVLGEIADPIWASELGQFNLEINVPPQPLAGGALTRLERLVRASLDHAGGRARRTGRQPALGGRAAPRRGGGAGPGHAGPRGGPGPAGPAASWCWSASCPRCARATSASTP